AKALNAWFEEAGIKGTNSPAARSFLNWGVPLHAPIPGCVVVYWRDKPEGWTGHVHLYVREDETHIYGIGGNQGNKVCEAAYAKDRVLAFRWPAGVAIPEPDADDGVSIPIVDAMALRDEFARVAKLLQGWSDELAAAIGEVA
ncbi:MAG: TIGR02594 family protein, partial [Candidatus Hydrogenedentes bacterium]|nr:TIGR02594 family protein [Candidatus Hydrogenedentota bacterium]